MYRTRSLSSVIRRKSIATVVVFLSGTCERSSTSVLATVMTASVVSGVISETEPTNVVLPTPNPPATTIFTDVMACDASATGRATLDLTESTKHPFEQMEVRTALRVIALVNADKAVRAHVGDEDSCHAQRQAQDRRDFGHRPPVPAELEDGLAFRSQHRKVTRFQDSRRHQRLNGELVSGLRPSAGNRIRPDKPGGTVFFGSETAESARVPHCTIVPPPAPYSATLPGAWGASERRPIVTTRLASHCNLRLQS